MSANSIYELKHDDEKGKSKKIWNVQIGEEVKKRQLNEEFYADKKHISFDVVNVTKEP